MTPSIRDCRLPEDLAVLTELLHRAYARLAVSGLKFVASHQSIEITERRIRRGHCFVAEVLGQPVGTITVRAPDPKSSIAAYREPGTFSFGQFGVDPDFAGRGIDRSLHERILDFAKTCGASAMELDTASPALELIRTYERWGWESTNYESVILKKDLKPAFV
jgi:GNAT superfamily N-acetyltransferase